MFSAGYQASGKPPSRAKIVARLPSAYLRIDTIEQTLRATSAFQDVGPSGYVLAYELASCNLELGKTVVADCANALPVTREAWRAVAVITSSVLLEVEVVCSDLTEHRRRVESRKADIPAFITPTWEDVLHHEYEAWTTHIWSLIPRWSKRRTLRA